MTKHLNSLAEMALELLTVEVGIYKALQVGLDRVLVRVEATAKSEFGVYQAEVGSFPAWPELADSTQEEREQLGYPPNEPLLREGDLRDSIGHEREGLEGAVGSTSDVMVYQEFGTIHVPARPVLGPAAFRNREAIQKLVGAAVVSGLVGADIAHELAADAVHESLGYNFSTSD